MILKAWSAKKKQGGKLEYSGWFQFPTADTKAQHSPAQPGAAKSLGCCFGLSGWYGVCWFFCAQLFMRRGSSLARPLPGTFNQPGSFSTFGFKMIQIVPHMVFRNIARCLVHQHVALEVGVVGCGGNQSPSFAKLLEITPST